jgi:hypothetical protein
MLDQRRKDFSSPRRGIWPSGIYNRRGKVWVKLGLGHFQGSAGCCWCIVAFDEAFSLMSTEARLILKLRRRLGGFKLVDSIRQPSKRWWAVKELEIVAFALPELNESII